uniref:SHSP domain-containing protein n=1 Tax=Rhabditophanes sp. KR3021 TaxID=114890 RepID=A0AC35UC35_9BILA
MDIFKELQTTFDASLHPYVSIPRKAEKHLFNGNFYITPWTEVEYKKGIFKLDMNLPHCNQKDIKLEVKPDDTLCVYAESEVNVDNVICKSSTKKCYQMPLNLRKPSLKSSFEKDGWLHVEAETEDKEVKRELLMFL